jgi:hypothetical protein
LIDGVKEENVIIGGDLILILNQRRFWGANGRMDPLAAYFMHKIEEAKFCDVELIKLYPT